MQLPFNRKSPAERVLEQVKSQGKPAKVGLVAAGGLAAITAASAGISSLRRQGQQ
jgi:hypothetical protein